MFLHWAGPVLSLIGVILGTWGTLLMCRAYHPFSTWKVIVHLADVMGSLLRGNTAAASQAIKDASEFARVNPENKYRTLTGVYILVFSFALQTIGAILILADLAAHPAR